MAAQLSLSLIAAPDTARLETRDVEGYEFTLGRGHDVDWSLLDPDRNILSRRHCMIVQEDGDWWVEDLSGNGTYLNHASTPIGHGARQRLRDGDRVRMGPYEFQVRLTATPTSAPFNDRAPFQDTGSDGWDRQTAAQVDEPWPPPVASSRPASPFGDEEPAPSAPAARERGGNPFLGSAATVPDDKASDAADNAWPPVSALPRSAGQADAGTMSDDWPPRVPPTPPQVPAGLPSGVGNPFLSAPAEASDPFPPVGRRVEAPSVTASPFDPPPPAEPTPPDHPPGSHRQASGLADVRRNDPGQSGPGRIDSGATDPGAIDSGAIDSGASDSGLANPFAEAGDEDGRTPPPVLRVVDPPEGVTPPPQASMVQPPAPSAVDAPAAVLPASVARPMPVAPDRLLNALLDGAGLPDATPRDPEQAMRALGQAFRAMVKGVRDAQRTRRTVRGEFRIAQTSFTQNPLKVAISDDDALEALLGAGRRGGMSPPDAVEEILLEIVQHEMATFAAMQDAVRVLVDSLAPEHLRARAEQAGGLAVLPAQRKARAWDLFEAEHARVAEALRDDFDSVFGKAFARAYERVMSEQGS